MLAAEQEGLRESYLRKLVRVGGFTCQKESKEFENVIVIQSELTGIKSSDVKISLILLLGYTSYYNMNFVATYSLHGQKNNYKQANNG
jgi:hypothetical protein